MSNQEKSTYYRIPEDVRETFTEEQKAHIHTALGAKSWKRHKVDIRFNMPV